MFEYVSKYIYVFMCRHVENTALSNDTNGVYFQSIWRICSCSIYIYSHNILVLIYIYLFIDIPYQLIRAAHTYWCVVQLYVVVPSVLSRPSVLWLECSLYSLCMTRYGSLLIAKSPNYWITIKLT